MNTECVFCSILQNQHTPALEDRILRQDNRFFLIAAIGPLTSPHLLVVSRQHILDIRRHSRADLLAYERFTARSLIELGLPVAQLVEIEHAPSKDHSAGPCINHSHTHWLFTDTNLANFLASRLPTIKAPGAQSFIWLRQHAREILLDSSGLRGQRLRGLLGEALGETEPDWAINPKLDEVHRIVNYLQRRALVEKSANDGT